MLYLAFIFHMHQPYYKNLLTLDSDLPWVRLHGVKDYLDMVKLLEKYPLIHQTFNLVPSLIEQIEDYANNTLKDKFLELSKKPAKDLAQQDRDFILQNFFSINKDRVISIHPRYYELFLKKSAKKDFTEQDLLDLQVWFNLSWIDPYFRQTFPELQNIVNKARFYTEEEKYIVLDKQAQILKQIIPAYKKLMDNKQIDVTLSPYYHPILPLLYNTDIAKEANPKLALPKFKFSYPEDAKAQIGDALNFYKSRFGVLPKGMWPSEQSVSEQIVPAIIQSGINWIVADEAILFKSLKKTKRISRLLYQPYVLKRKEGELNIIFRDRNLSDLIGFVYYNLKPDAAVADLLGHLENINNAFKGQDLLVTIAMDGENAWEYYSNDGHDFLELLYARLSESRTVKTVTISEYLSGFSCAKTNIKRLSAGSWIYGDFGKWFGSPAKIRAWEYLTKARSDFEAILKSPPVGINLGLAKKQMHICEGSDWFWWAGEDPNGDFDKLFRMHLSNLYCLLGKDAPVDLKTALG